MTIAPTLTIRQAARHWPAVVVGAGPAGAVAALGLARRGVEVLLVDQASFPRTKVCGSCLSGAALAALGEAGLGELPARLGAVPLMRFAVHAGGRSATLPLTVGVAVSREALDAALVREAIAAGAHFLPLTRASILPDAEGSRSVQLRQAGEEARVGASVVLAASGLGSTAGRVAEGSLIGVGAIIETRDPYYRRGDIVMSCGDGGYVGAARLEDDRLDIACALDVRAARAAGGPAALAARILRGNRCPVPIELTHAAWRGTPPLTRRAIHVAERRLLTLGDAAGYVEPFTGEGVGWALASAVAIADLAADAARSWHPSIAAEWSRRHRLLVGRRQRVCRAAAAVLRRPALAASLVTALAWFPSLARPVTYLLNRPASLERGTR